MAFLIVSSAIFKKLVYQAFKLVHFNWWMKKVVCNIPKWHTDYCEILLTNGIFHFGIMNLIDQRKRYQLGALLVKAREQANLTQKQVEKTGITTQSELSKVENGQRKLDFLMIVQLAKLYKKPLDFFIPKD